MATVITTDNDIILYISNGDAIIDEEDKIITFIDEQVKIPRSLAANIYEVDSIPENVEPIKYIYADGAFSENPEFKETYSVEERVSVLEDVVNILLGF